MPVEHLDLGPTPHLVINCDANLDIRGADREDIRLESDAPLKITESADGLTVQSHAHCYIRLPEGAAIKVREVRGSCRVKDVTGSVDIDMVNGSCHVRRVGALQIGDLRGEGRIREVNGPVKVHHAAGALTLRDVTGPVSIEHVRGDLLGRDVPEGMTVDEIRGNLALLTNFAAESTSQFDIRGDATFRIPVDTSVRFLIAEDVLLKLDKGLKAHSEGAYQTVIIGDGAATVTVERAASVTIKQRGDYEDASFAYSFALGNELSDHLADLSAELETQTEYLQASLLGTSDRIRRHVEKRLDVARRQVEAAQRRVEREVERAQSDTENATRSVFVAVGVDDDRPSSDPVSESERLIILQMLEDGKISVEEAEDLLTALEGK